MHFRAESEPRCSTNVSAKYGYVKEFDYLAFRCAVNYSGYWTPSMQWSTGGRALDGSTYVINSNVSQGVEHLSSAITLQVGAELDGFLVSCKTWFSETSMKVHHTNAANVPDYVFNWNTTLNIHCEYILTFAWEIWALSLYFHIHFQLPWHETASNF